MVKKLLITCCSDCCHFDNFYYDYNQKCMKLQKENEDYETSILEDCPLENGE